MRSLGWVAIALLLVLWPLLSPAQPAVSRLALAPDPNSRFGVVFVHGVTPDSNQPYPDPQPRYEKAKASGAAFTRWPIYWHLIETSRDYFNYASQDQVAELDIQNGLEVNAILMGTPSWGGVSTSETGPAVPFGIGPHLPDQPSPGAARFGAGSSFMAGSAGAVPLGLQLPPFLSNGAVNPENRWANFVYKTVKRYMPGGELAQQKGWAQNKGIRYWEMWNEPDFTWANDNGQQVPVFWEGGAENYYRLLKVGYLAAKAADPQATVVFGGLQYWSDQDFFPRVLDHIKGDPDARTKNYFFDAVPYHLYINPYNIFNVAQWANSEMQKRGMAKSIWINETNLPVFDDDNTTDGKFCPGWQGTQDEQASFVIQASALGMASWVERIFLFQLYDDNVAYRENFGLVRNDGSERPSYTAYQVAATYLANPVSPRRTTLENGAVDSVSFINSKYGKVTVLWNTTTEDRTAKLAASTPRAQLIDKAGNASWVDSSNNSFSVTLPKKSRYDIPGCVNRWSDQPGSPYILLEHINTDLSSKVSPLPAVTNQASFPVSWSRLDTVGGTVTYDIQYRVGKDGPWTDWLTNTDKTSATFGPAQGGKTYYFRSRARMGEIAEPLPDGDGDAFTTVKLYLTGRILDNRGRPVAEASVAASVSGTQSGTSAPATAKSDMLGNYTLELPAGGSYQVAISRPGFGALPAKSIDVNSTISYDFALPPKDDVMKNGGFELGTASWITAGKVITQTFRHTGNYGATISQSGTLSQTVSITTQGQSTLSFFYRTPSPSSSDRFEVQLVGNKTLSFVFPLSQNTWQQGWVDTTGLQGPATVIFRFAGQGDLWLDEVALGSSTNWIFLPRIERGYSGP